MLRKHRLFFTTGAIPCHRGDSSSSLRLQHLQEDNFLSRAFIIITKRAAAAVAAGGEPIRSLRVLITQQAIPWSDIHKQQRTNFPDFRCTSIEEKTIQRRQTRKACVIREPITSWFLLPARPRPPPLEQKGSTIASGELERPSSLVQPQCVGRGVSSLLKRSSLEILCGTHLT